MAAGRFADAARADHDRLGTDLERRPAGEPARPREDAAAEAARDEAAREKAQAVADAERALAQSRQAAEALRPPRSRPRAARSSAAPR
ncbi:MAG: hypothetical protein R3F60_27405 [bacterium]